MKIFRNALLALCAYGLSGCMIATNDAAIDNSPATIADISNYAIKRAETRPSVSFGLPSRFSPLPEGPMVEAVFLSFSSPSGSTIDVFLESRILAEACQAQPCELLKHTGWNRVNPIEHIYPKGVLTLSPKFERRDIFANLRTAKERGQHSLRFVIKCNESESCIDARDSILRTVEIQRK
jgi:hypothetical protein